MCMLIRGGYFSFISVSSEKCPYKKRITFPKKDMTIPYSCRDRCFNTTNRSPMLECMCDQACMFLGDCCSDYLLECNPRKLNNSTAIREQYSVFRHFDKYSSCINLDALRHNNALRMVNKCPYNFHNDSLIQSMCSNPSGKGTMSSCVPVESDGVLYRNIYCAACHGLVLHQLHRVASYGFQCSMNMQKSELHLLPFAKNIPCLQCIIKIRPRFIYIKRYGDACWCRQALPDRSCKISLYKEECNAYSRVTLDRLRRPYNNEACKSCDNDGKANVPKPRHCKCLKPTRPDGVIGLFDFTGISSSHVYVCTKYYKKGQSDNPCLLKHCQHGFQVHDDICISKITAHNCYPPKQNRHNSDYLISNLFRAALVIHYKASSVNESLFPKHLHIKLEKRKPCTHLPTLYQNLYPHGLDNSIQCALLYFDPLAFAKLYVDLSVEDISKNLFPQLKIVHTMLLNHDPLSGISCSAGTRCAQINNLHVFKGGIVQGISQDSKQIVTSNKEPIVIVHNKYGTGIKVWTFMCRPILRDENCSSQLMVEQLSPMTSCLKYEMTDRNTGPAGTILLKSGKTLTNGEYMHTKDGTILVCADVYDKLNPVISYTWSIIVTISYTISLVCLMATFIIYLRYRELRTLPGLMLMNLIVALFFAQMLFLLNAWDLFENDPIVCLIMATAQHYFWLASFAWMGCMSLDIFRCLSTASTTINTYSASKYSRYILAGWGIPLPFPLTANLLTITTSSTLAYDTAGSCWMANPQGVLYLFAIPVLTLVCSNILHFIGSVYRLCTLMKNASLAGRKEDNKHRLAQCIKLSSWMGVSWLFGIIPNIVGIDALWYVFVSINALQGLHIFLAFGITGRARILMKGSCQVHMAMTTISPSVTTVATDRQAH